MPEGAIYCGRPGVLGNPFPHNDDDASLRAVSLGLRGDERGRREAAVRLHRAWLADVWAAAHEPLIAEIDRETRRKAASFACILYPLPYGRDVLAARRSSVLAMLPDLRGHDLVCWCRLDQPCHVDTYPEITRDG